MMCHDDDSACNCEGSMIYIIWGNPEEAWMRQVYRQLRAEQGMENANKTKRNKKQQKDHLSALRRENNS